MNLKNRTAAEIHPYFENPYTNDERKHIVGERLLEIRKHYGLTQKEVSEIIGVTAQTYSGYENGKFEPSAETLVRLAYLFNTTVDFLTAKNNIPGDVNSEDEDMINTYSEDNEKLVHERLDRMEMAIEELKKHISPSQK